MDSTLATLRRSRLSGIIGLLAVAFAAAVALVAVPAAQPAHAIGNCTAGTPAAFWRTPYSVQLKRTTNCQYYARLVVDDELWGVGMQITWKVERQQYTTYGWYTTETKSRSTYWGGGTKDTAKVEGLYPTADPQDRHRVCYRFNSGAWTCSGYVNM